MINQPAEPFFLDASPGKRFCLFYPAVQETLFKQAVVYIHPFAEEMNKSRRMAALQAKALTKIGYSVLQIDLYGCGDSEGDFGEAAWEIWQADIEYAYYWLRQQEFTSIHFWGLRLGAVLALDCARKTGMNVEKLVLWQPVISGKSFLTQFLRLKLVNTLLSNNGEKVSGTKGLRQQLNTGQSLEIAGYTLSSAMAVAIDTLRLDQLAVNNSEIYWFEIISDTERGLSHASTAVIEKWQQSGVQVATACVAGLPFWATQEISECPELLTATTNTFATFAGIQL